MPLNSQKIIAAFNKAASDYDSVSILQQKIGEKLIHYLPHTQFNTLIDLGCGTGLTTKKLALATQYQRFDAIDFSPLMINQAKKYHSMNISFQQGTFDRLSKNTYDLIFSNMALHWNLDFEKTLKTIALALKKNGFFVFSLPIMGTFKELAPFFNIHKFYSSEAIIKKLITAGFLIKNTENITEHLTFSHLIDGLRMLKKTGATVCERHDFSYATTRNCIRNNVIQSLTYHVGLFVVEKS